MDHQPYYRFQMLVDDWVDDIKKQKEERDKQEQQQKAESRKYNKGMGNFKQPKLPRK